jgi:hypothetical protein
MTTHILTFRSYINPQRYAAKTIIIILVLYKNKIKNKYHTENKERRKHDFDHEYVPCVVDTIPSFMTEL